MKFVFSLGVAAGLLLAGCSGGSDQSAKGTNSTASGSSPASAPADYLGALGKAQQSAVKTTDVASLTQALQAYSVDKGHFPKDLNELVQEKYISRIPAPPTGSKFVYDSASGTVKVAKE
jgi:hypothetical protein